MCLFSWVLVDIVFLSDYTIICHSGRCCREEEEKEEETQQRGSQEEEGAKDVRVGGTVRGTGDAFFHRNRHERQHELLRH